MATISSRFLTKNIESLVGLGLDSDVLMGLVPGGNVALNNPTQRFHGDVLINIFDRAQDITGDSGIGFRCGLNHSHVVYSDIAFTILYCKNLKESFEVSAQFEPLAQQYGINELKVEGDEAQIIWTTHQDEPDRLRHISDLSFATLALMGMWVKTIHGLSIRRMQLRHCDESYHDLYFRMFACPIEYGAERDILTFDKSFLKFQLPGHNPKMFKLLTARLTSDMAALGQPMSDSQTVKIYIEKILGEDPPTIERVANLMALPAWTLRRRLRAVGTSFREILEAVRRERYQILALQPEHSQLQIAGLLGYSEQSAFSRAYKSWYGASPVRANGRALTGQKSEDD